jgi:pimeloyl-ACP methyl ester carboxylesterase
VTIATSIIRIKDLVIAGSGFSSALVNPSSVDADNVHLHELLTSSQENTTNLVYVGFSRGGLLGVSFANTYPELVKSLVLIDPMYVH